MGQREKTEHREKMAQREKTEQRILLLEDDAAPAIVVSSSGLSTAILTASDALSSPLPWPIPM